ncbi:unnamed protein product [Caenorhabditis angaria]|uniref:Uncharacterized protein n=1 Tax=Caenorhabditis angaria TaxID=860376 RepID=A0A9P1IMB1_9PELO|nr:unnamed protein product [Caenorhabditis angaria]
MDQKTLQRLEEFENSKQFYDALQFYRTKVTRSFRLKNALELSNPLVKHAVDFFLREKQYQCAIDIITLYAESLEKNGVELDDVAMDLIAETSAKLVEVIEDDDNEFSEADESLLVASRRKFVEISIQWSKSKSKTEQEQECGSYQLHYLFAKKYAEKSSVELAKNHYLLAENPQEFSDFLLEVTKNSIEIEVDLLIAQIVLQLLCIDRFPYAKQVFEEFTRKIGAKTGEKQGFDLPLLNFINILFDVVAKVDVTQYAVIVETYVSEIERDETFKGYLSRIGKIYFGIRDQVPMAGGLAGMLSGLMGGGMAAEKEETAKSHLNSSPPQKIAKFSVPASVAQARAKNAASAIKAATSSASKKPATAPVDDDLD